MEILAGETKLISIEQKVKKILYIILFINLAIAFIKIVLGHLIKSSSITADGFHSLSDGFSNVVGLIGIYFAAKPKDEQHPYGHKRFENMTGFLIGSILAVFAFNIIRQAFVLWENPVVPVVGIESLIVLVFTLIVNIFVANFEYKKGKELKSDILLADSLHTRSDILVTVGVLIAMLAIYFGAPPIIDVVISVFVAGFILVAAVNIIIKTCNILLDAAAVDVEKIKSLVLDFPDVKGIHAIRSRSSGSTIYLDMHILVEPNMSVQEMHDLVHEIEKDLREKIHEDIQAIIHPEPFNKEKN